MATIMGTVIPFLRRVGSPPSKRVPTLPPAVDLESLLFRCALSVDPFSPEMLDLYFADTGDSRPDPDSLHEWLFFEQRENVSLIPVLAGIALRTSGIRPAHYAAIIAEMRELQRSTEATNG